MAHEYFICHSSADKDLAEEAVSALEAAGHTTWLAPRDIPAGDPWPGHINQAIQDTQTVLLIGTATAFDSKHVDREIALADKFGKSVLPIIVDNAVVPPDVEYYLGATQALITSRDQLGTVVRRYFGVPLASPRYDFVNREVVETDGQRITFRRWGDCATQPVLLIHGLGMSADDWDADEQVAAMRGRPATFIAPDLPQHQAWDSDRTTTLPEVVHKLGALMSALGYFRYGVVGHSLGGVIAMHLVARDQRVQWCVAGGVTAQSWQLKGRRPLIDMLKTGEPKQPGDEALLRFLRSRNHDLSRLATLCGGSMPDEADLHRLVERLSILTTADDQEGTAVLLERAGLPAATQLPGDHVSSFLSGQFLEAALDLRCPRIQVKSTRDRPVFMSLTGLPGSGKTLLAKTFAVTDGLRLVSRHQIRHEIGTSPSYSQAESQSVAEEVARRLEGFIEEHRGVVFEGTCLEPSSRESLRQWLQSAESHGFRTVPLWLVGDPPVIRARLAQRSADERLLLDSSAADADVYEVLRSRARPGWVGVRCDVTDVSEAVVSDWVRHLMDGRISSVDAPAYLLGQAVLAEAAATAVNSRVLPWSPWVRELLARIEADAAAGIFDRWGSSTLVDTNVGRPVVVRGVLDRLLKHAGLAGSVECCNAGLAHTYGYLFSHEETPYGYKRDRWLDGELRSALGLRRGFLEPLPSQGSLLSNLTSALDAHLFGEDCPWVDKSAAEVSCLTEQDVESGISTYTWLIGRSGVPQKALVHAVQQPGQRIQYVTAFPVGEATVTEIEDAADSTEPLAACFNAVLPGTFRAPAQRRWTEQWEPGDGDRG